MFIRLRYLRGVEKNQGIQCVIYVTYSAGCVTTPGTKPTTLHLL